MSSQNFAHLWKLIALLLKMLMGHLVSARNAKAMKRKEKRWEYVSWLNTSWPHSAAAGLWELFCYFFRHFWCTCLCICWVHLWKYWYSCNKNLTWLEKVGWNYYNWFCQLVITVIDWLCNLWQKCCQQILINLGNLLLCIDAPFS